MSRKFNYKRLGEAFEADWPVEVSVPQDGGKASVETFMARFRMINQERMKEIVEDPDPNAMLRAAFVGFGKGEEEDFSEEIFAAMVGDPPTRAGLLSAYTKFSQGIAVKN